MTIAAGAGGSIGSGAVIVVTVGTDGGTQWGFNSGLYGSRSPTTLYGQNILIINSETTAPLVTVRIATVLAATFFNTVTFSYGASGATFKTLAASAATFSTAGGFSTWTWSASTFTTTDNTLARNVTFYR